MNIHLSLCVLFCALGALHLRDSRKRQSVQPIHRFDITMLIAFQPRLENVQIAPLRRCRCRLES